MKLLLRFWTLLVISRSVQSLSGIDSIRHQFKRMLKPKGDENLSASLFSRNVLLVLAGTMAAASMTATVLPVYGDEKGPTLATVTPSSPSVFNSPDKTFSFALPPSVELEVSPKLVKTHEYEIYLKSVSQKGFSVGTTMDKVKIEKIEDFAGPRQLADRVVKVELEKDGVFEANVLDVTEEKGIDPPITYYSLDYTVDSSRGFKHYRVKTTVADKKLYVFTVQSNEDKYSALKGVSDELIASFKILR